MSLFNRRIVLVILASILILVLYYVVTDRNLSCGNEVIIRGTELDETLKGRGRIRESISSPRNSSASASNFVPRIGQFPESAIIPTVKDKFSIIIPTYRRVKLLTRVLKNYCALEGYIDTIIVVWNDLASEIPQTLERMPCNVTLLWKKEKVNSLNNRFLPFSEIRTEAVLSADDDLIIPHEDLKFQFITWQRFRHLLVGFAARRHMEQPPGSGHYVYIKKVSKEDPRYSFILTTSAMFHVSYLSLYQKKLSDKLRNFIDENMNCEDLIINAIIAQHLTDVSGVPGAQCPALMVEEFGIRLIEKENEGYEGLWHRQKHKSVRETCLSLIADEFHGIPFDYSTLKVSRIFPIRDTVKIS